MLPLPRFDASNQDIKPFALGRTEPGGHQSLYLPKGEAIVVIRSDIFD
jgi:hypothetical protein